MPSPASSSALRARLRPAAVVLLALLALAALVLAVQVYFFPSGSAVAGGLVGAFFAVVGIVYAVLVRLVVRQSRTGHIVAVVVCACGAVLSVSGRMEWPDWVVLVANLLAAVLLLGCVPHRTARRPG